MHIYAYRYQESQPEIHAKPNADCWTPGQSQVLMPGNGECRLLRQRVEVSAEICDPPLYLSSGALQTNFLRSDNV